ncbi:MAG: LacI family DNA-binding transcriptional regulator [Bacteroidota bacterium]
MGRITIKDIAKLLEVNPSTVSRALKDHPDIGVAMKLKVKQVANDLGYRPNYQAIRFRQNKSGLIGLIIPELGMFFFPSVVKAIEGIVKKNGYNLIILHSNDFLEKEKEGALICQNFGLDGLLVCLSKQTLNVQHFAEIMHRKTPVVFFDKVIQQPALSTVVINDKSAAFTAINHLAKKGYKKISGVFNHANLEISQRRRDGFLAALAKHKLPYYEEFCFHSDSLEKTKTEFAKLLEQPVLPDAVFAMTDQILAGIIQVIYEKGLSIPDQLAVICISNGNLPYYLNPTITHIRHSGHEVGKAAVELLFDLMNDQIIVEKRQVELETFLVELDSC